MFYTLTVGKGPITDVELIGRAAALWKLEEGTYSLAGPKMAGPDEGAKTPKDLAAAKGDFPQYPGPDALAPTQERSTWKISTRDSRCLD